MVVKWPNIITRRAAERRRDRGYDGSPFCGLARDCNLSALVILSQKFDLFRSRRGRLVTSSSGKIAEGNRMSLRSRLLM